MCDSKSIIVLDEINDEYAKILTDWYYNWWGKEENWSIEKVYDYVVHSTSKKVLPKTFIYVEDNILKGVCMLSYSDVDNRPDIYPWLINMYVDEKYRSNNICHLLINKAISYLKENNFKEVYLYTKINGLYEQFNFKKIDKINIYDESSLYDLYKLEIA